MWISIQGRPSEEQTVSHGEKEVASVAQQLTLLGKRHGLPFLGMRAGGSINGLTRLEGSNELVVP